MAAPNGIAHASYVPGAEVGSVSVDLQYPSDSVDTQVWAYNFSSLEPLEGCGVGNVTSPCPSIVQGYGCKNRSQCEQKAQEAEELVGAAASRHGAQLVLLSEEFIFNTAAGQGAPEPVPAGPTAQLCASWARKWGIHLVCTLRELVGTAQYNGAVLFSRSGQVLYKYHKAFPAYGTGGDGGVVPGASPVAVIPTPVGRLRCPAGPASHGAPMSARPHIIAILTQHPHLFRLELPGALASRRRRADIVLWPSAYGGGLPLQAFAGVHNYYIAANGHGAFFDNAGRQLNATQDGKIYAATLDLQRVVVHTNDPYPDPTGHAQPRNSRARVAAMVQATNGTVYVAQLLAEDPRSSPFPDYPEENWMVLAAGRPGVCVRQVMARFGLESLRTFRHRARAYTNLHRALQQPVDPTSSA
eukprot:gene8384-1497_t